MTAELPEVVFRFFASDPAGPMLTLDREASDPRDDLRGPLEEFLASFGTDDVATVQSDENFRFFSDDKVDKDRAARVWLGERFLSGEIARRRLKTIREDQRAARPAPYDLPALDDLPISDDHLVPLSAFQFDGARLLRNDYAFMVLPTTGSPNSTHWLLAAIFEQGLTQHAHVRLDPFLCGPAETFPAMFYRMWMYGRPLNWARVHALQTPEHGRWMPSPGRSRGQFTDFAWTPRAEEVHFVCEEIPPPNVVSEEAARYLHAVYSRSSRAIEHFDGALRLYQAADLHERGALHARNAGKMGLREKVFLVDGPHDANVLGHIAQAFFVWNDDVREYFSNTFAFQETA